MVFCQLCIESLLLQPVEKVVTHGSQHQSDSKCQIVWLSKYCLKYVEKNKCWALTGKKFLMFSVERAPVLGGYLQYHCCFCCAKSAPLPHESCWDRKTLPSFPVFFLYPTPGSNFMGWWGWGVQSGATWIIFIFLS